MSETDETTTVGELKQMMLQFAKDRDWLQFHSPKNLAMAIAVEAGELMDIFRWDQSEASFARVTGAESKQAVADEVADVALLVLQFATVAKIDLATAVRSKLAVNVDKYPVSDFKGRPAKYTEQ